MNKYDDIVVGSGISGMTMALILGMNGRKVLLIEKSAHIGGSMARFYKKGIPFDTGFHFTGGLQKGEILHDILTVLEISDHIEPIFLSRDSAHSFFIESDGRHYDIPYGEENVKSKLKSYFPGEVSAIDRYFEMIKSACDKTPSMDLRSLMSSQNFIQDFIDEDFISLQQVLNDMTGNQALQTLLSALVMCSGVKPNEVSFANYSRMCQSLYQSVARVRNGGDAFVKAFKTKFNDYDIEISCNTHIVDLTDISDKKVGRFVLNDGREISAKNCLFTIHPKEILKILPKKRLRPAFIDRVSSFEQSLGFFSVFAVLDSGEDFQDFDASIFSIFPHYDLNTLLDPLYTGNSAMALVRSTEQVRDRTYKIISIFETSYIEHVKAWENSGTGSRPPDYQDYKKAKTDSIMERVFKVFPEYRGKIRVIDSASVLTFRDYLNNYDGSAYGIKQKLNQINLIGKLPLRNLYAAGQSSLLPGIIGAMMSSFLVGRTVIEEEKFNKFLLKNLDK